MKTDVFVVMPNHAHGIIFITDECRGRVSPPHRYHQGEETSPLQKLTLGQFVTYFKYQTTKQANKTLNTVGASLWQRNYYEHVIRNEDDLRQIREYIVNNPLKWELDSENPKNIKELENREMICILIGDFCYYRMEVLKKFKIIVGTEQCSVLTSKNKENSIKLNYKEKGL